MNEPDERAYCEMSREQLEKHAARMAQALADDKPREFYRKHAVGPLMAPSCLVCGQLPEKIAITHLELPGIVVCEKCHTNARAERVPASVAPSLGDVQALADKWVNALIHLNGPTATDDNRRERLDACTAAYYAFNKALHALASVVPDERAVTELRNIAEAKRHDRTYFDDDTAFADWAQSRARHCLGVMDGN